MFFSGQLKRKIVLLGVVAINWNGKQTILLGLATRDNFFNQCGMIAKS